MGDVVLFVQPGEVTAHEGIYTLPAGTHTVNIGLDCQVFHVSPTRARTSVGEHEELPPLLIAADESLKVESFAEAELYIRFLARSEDDATALRRKFKLKYNRKKIDAALKKEQLRRSI